MSAAARRPWAAAVLPAAVLAIVVVGGAVLPRLLVDGLRVRVELSAAPGTRISFQTEDEARPPQTTVVATSGLSSELFRARREFARTRFVVDRSGGVDVSLRRVQVLHRGAVIRSYSPAEIATWANTFSEVAVGPDAVRLTSPAASAAFDHWQIVRSWDGLAAPLRVVARLVDGRNRLQVALCSVCLLVGALAAGSRRGRWAVAVAAAGSGLAAVMLEGVVRHPHGVARASQALGRSTYLGLSLPTNLRAVSAMVVVAVLTGVGAGLAWRRRDPPVPSGVSAEGSADTVGLEGDRRRRLVVSASAAGVGVLALAMFLPDVAAMLRSAPHHLYPAGWDAGNLTAWDSFAARGLVPMRDFWYPYGNSLVFHRFVDGAVILAAYRVVLALGFWWVFWVSSGRRVVATSAGAVLFVLLAFPALGSIDRYGLALLVALAYTAIDPDVADRRDLTRLVFGVLVTIALFVEPVLVGYAAVGISAALVLDIVRGRRRGLAWWVRRAGRDLAMPAVAVALWCIVAGLRGQLPQTVALYRSLGVSAAYSAAPADLRSLMHDPVDLQSLMIWLIPGVVAVGIFLRLSEAATGLAHTLASRLVVTGATALPVLQKHAVRPAGDTLLLFPVTALALALVTLRRAGRNHLVMAAAVGSALAATLAFPGSRMVLQGAGALPARLPRDLRVLLLERRAVERAEAQRFAPERFASFDASAVADDLRPRLDPARRDNVLVLGDAPIVYTVLDQLPPWQINVYDSSPLAQQRRVTSWIDSHRPRFVVLAGPEGSFDDVPHAVRIPLLFQRVVEDYTYDHSVNSFDILRRRTPADPVDGAFWARRLPSEINLGFVPNVSSHRLRPCSAGGDGRCGRVLRVRSARPRDGSPSVAIRLAFGGHHFTVSFRAASGRREYVIPLSRTWPWALSHDVSLAADPPAGWEVSVVPADVDPNRLY